MPISLSSRLLFPMLLAMLWAAGGCGTPAATLTPQAPESYSLTLFTSTPTLRYTWFELTKARELRHAGGREALHRNGELVTTFTPAQMQEVWDIIYRGKLHEAPAGALFPEGKEAVYDFTLNTGGFDMIIRAADNEQPALKQLHDYLFKTQATIRHGR